MQMFHVKHRAGAGVSAVGGQSASHGHFSTLKCERSGAPYWWQYAHKPPFCFVQSATDSGRPSTSNMHKNFPHLLTFFYKKDHCIHAQKFSTC